MIMIRNEVLTAVSDAVEQLGATCVSSYTSGATMPLVTFEQIDSTPLVKTQTRESLEYHATVTFELNYYSNKANGKQSECYSLAEAADTVMAGYGFTRKLLRPVPNLEDATIYRLTARYTAVVGSDGYIYRK